ncbi:MAG: 3-deoxy-D-manno-octulosonic acid transferase [Alphaproteobacteria bacterium]|nr:3-deoxy-D-manno-octulosonic acid transferase [Alphaproteobacteria bacterium]
MILPALYRGLTASAAPFIIAYLKTRRLRGKEDESRFNERLGFASDRRPDGPLVWVHAASIGEAASVLALIERILEERPQLHILLTTGTVAAARLLSPRLPPGARHQFVPADLPRAVARFLDHWRPELAVWVESELWPNLVLMTRQRNIPMLLLNARLSARSHARWRRWPQLARPVIGAFSLCLAQDETQVRRFRELGAPAAASIGDLKAAAKNLVADPAVLGDLRRQAGNRPLWLAASTHEGEDEIAIQVHDRLARDHPRLLTIIAPRHPVRGDAIAALAAAKGLRVARRSRGDAISADTDLYLADTFGELGLFYSLVPVAFVGGSLVDKGGHNPFEAARLDCAVLLGPHTANCTAMAEALIRCGAAEVVANAGALASALARLLDDEMLRAQRARAAAHTAAQGAGILDAALDRLAPWLDPIAQRPPAQQRGYARA